MIRPLLLATALIAVPAIPAAAEVVQSTPAGFEISHTVVVPGSVERAWAVALAPRLWWNKDHTYSGDSANLTIDERPGGCFCEKLPGKAGVEHLRVAYIQPPRMVRMIGALGPLQAEGADGSFTIALTKTGDATKIVMSYVVGGYIRSGAEKMASLVDRVLGEQMAGLRAAIEAGPGASAARPAAAKAAPAKPAAAEPRIDADPLADVGETISSLPAEEKPDPATAGPAPVDPPTDVVRPADAPKEPVVNPESPR